LPLKDTTPKLSINPHFGKPWNSIIYDADKHILDPREGTPKPVLKLRRCHPISHYPVKVSGQKKMGYCFGYSCVQNGPKLHKKYPNQYPTKKAIPFKYLEYLELKGIKI